MCIIIIRVAAYNGPVYRWLESSAVRWGRGVERRKSPMPIFKGPEVTGRRGCGATSEKPSEKELFVRALLDLLLAPRLITTDQGEGVAIEMQGSTERIRRHE